MPGNIVTLAGKEKEVMNPHNETMPFKTHEIILIEKIRKLPLEKITEIENYIDFLSYQREHNDLLHMTNKLSEEVFQNVWNNPEDDVYNDL